MDKSEFVQVLWAAVWGMKLKGPSDHEWTITVALRETKKLDIFVLGAPCDAPTHPILQAVVWLYRFGYDQYYVDRAWEYFRQVSESVR